jgi:hypothetical protein
MSWWRRHSHQSGWWSSSRTTISDEAFSPSILRNPSLMVVWWWGATSNVAYPLHVHLYLLLSVPDMVHTSEWALTGFLSGPCRPGTHLSWSTWPLFLLILGPVGFTWCFLVCSLTPCPRILQETCNIGQWRQSTMYLGIGWVVSIIIEIISQNHQ